MICPACNKPIGGFHKTPNGFHRDCFKHWEQGYDCAMKFCNDENAIAGYPTPFELYKRRSENWLRSGYEEIKEDLKSTT